MESIHTVSGGELGAGSISSSAIELVDSYAIAGTGQTTTMGMEPRVCKWYRDIMRAGTKTNSARSIIIYNIKI